MKPTIERFLSKINVIGSGCWEWKGNKNYKGYGNFSLKDKYVSAHRFIYEYYHGSICPDLTIDHLCQNRACVNPQHLEEVTLKINILRGNGLCAINARKTHCKRGHEFIEENTYLDKNGGRYCRICKKQSIKLWQQNNQETYNTYSTKWRQINREKIRLKARLIRQKRKIEVHN